jgi:hypothetical protein
VRAMRERAQCATRLRGRATETNSLAVTHGGSGPGRYASERSKDPDSHGRAADRWPNGGVSVRTRTAHCIALWAVRIAALTVDLAAGQVAEQRRHQGLEFHLCGGEGSPQGLLASG